MIYLHGRIVQEKQSARPQSPEYGFYELEQILDAFRSKGFVVTGEMGDPSFVCLVGMADRGSKPEGPASRPGCVTSGEGIDDLHSGLLEIPGVARNDRQAMSKSRCGNHSIQ